MHILNHTHRFNGNVHAAVDLACAQADLGHDVALCSASGDFDQILADHGVTRLRLDQSRRIDTLAKAVLGLARHIKRWQPDLVHAHMVTSALLAYPPCRIARKPLITTVHNAFERTALLMGVGTRVIAVSQAVAEKLRRRRIPERVLRTVLNGTIGSARFADAKPEAVALQHPNALFVGGMHPRKGVADLLKAFQEVHEQVPEAHLYLIGEGPYEAEYRALVDASAARDAITFCGAVRDPRPYLRAADIFVLPSLADPAPLVLSEAREAGCAMIGTRVDGIPELLENGEAGILVEPGRPHDLADELRRLLFDPHVLATYRSRSQIRIERLAVERVARETLAVYQDCLPATHAGGAPSRSTDDRAAATSASTISDSSLLLINTAPAGKAAGAGLSAALRGAKVPTTIAVIYATAGRSATLAQTIAVLENQRRRPDEIIVSCASAADVEGLPAQDRLRILTGPRGLTRQRNAALRELDGKADIVVFFDDDFVPHAGWLEAVDRAFRERPDVVCITGLVLADGIKGPGLEMRDATAALAEWVEPAEERVMDPYSPYGCNMAFRNEAIQGLFFDERLVLYGWLEDRDFGGALAKRGGRLIKIGTAAGVHLGTKRGRETGRRLGYSQVVNPVYLYRKGTVTFWSMLQHVSKNLLANASRSLMAEPYVDRVGRLLGNGLGLMDLVCGRVVPERIESR